MKGRKNTNNWYEKNAKLLDIELDDEILKETQVDTDKNLKEKRKLQQLKSELEDSHFVVKKGDFGFILKNWQKPKEKIVNVEIAIDDKVEIDDEFKFDED